MEWISFFKKVKFFKSIVLFMTAFIILGTILIFHSSNIMMGILVLLLSMFICYIINVGIMILSIDKALNSRYRQIVGGVFNAFIIFLVGYKLINIYRPNLFILILYLASWIIYLKQIYHIVNRID